MSAPASAPSAGVGIVLVHGLFHGPWCWEPIVERLAPEFEVSVPELPLTSLSADVETVRAAIAQQRAAGRRVLVVGHSYGGMVVSGAAHDAQHLIYLAAVVPDEGQTLARASPNSRGANRNRTRAIVVGPDLVQLSDSDDDVVATFYHRTPRERYDAIKTLLRPVARVVYGEPVGPPAWLDVPTSYIVCCDDVVLDPAYQRDKAARFEDRYVLDADHSAFYSATEPLVGIITDTARALAAG